MLEFSLSLVFRLKKHLAQIGDTGEKARAPDLFRSDLLILLL